MSQSSPSIQGARTNLPTGPRYLNPLSQPAKNFLAIDTFPALQGLNEIQIAESYGNPVDSHNMGALYSRITPASAAEKPVGEWQTLDITLVDRHITVILNGVKIIDNAPALGCTGGALTSDEFAPGPIMLQGDHTSIDYRNMVVLPVQK